MTDTIESLKSQLAEAQRKYDEINEIACGTVDDIFKMENERDQAIKQLAVMRVSLKEMTHLAQAYVRYTGGDSQGEDVVNIGKAVLAQSPNIEGLVVVKDEPIYLGYIEFFDDWVIITKAEYDAAIEAEKRIVYAK